MPRLRALLVTETGETGPTRTRDILILDGLTLEECDTLGQAGQRPDDIPPILGFPFNVDLPENEDTPDTVTVDIAAMSAEQTEQLRALVRQTLRIDGIDQRR